MRSRAERAAAGKACRSTKPLSTQALVEPSPNRDPVGLLLGQAELRVPELVPLRHGRMLVSPFTYYRGAALPMAADLAQTPSSGLTVQLCGDAHVANFGVFASPERRLVFDLNDFDETSPGPFEWDVKRFVASLVIAARDNAFSKKEQRQVVLAGAEAYRRAMRDFAAQGMLQVWYARLDALEHLERVQAELKPSRAKAVRAQFAKARTRDRLQAVDKLTAVVDGRRRFLSNPPVVVPVEELLPMLQAHEIEAGMRDLVERYSQSLNDDRRVLLRHFDLVHVARKVVGVGSVGTRAWILLLEADDGEEPLILQAKEAAPSVLAAYAGAGSYEHQGQRVVAGQRLMQADSDIFLGWQSYPGADGVERDFYMRQLRDWKLGLPIERMVPGGMTVYARTCAWTLARAHARSGDRIAIAAYLGGSDRFERAMVTFAEDYADLNEQDHAALQRAVDEGRATATEG
jgi:uncharacterized protein (DUF2252 family)